MDVGGGLFFRSFNISNWCLLGHTFEVITLNGNACVVYFDQLLGAARTQKLVEIHKVPTKKIGNLKRAKSSYYILRNKLILCHQVFTYSFGVSRVKTYTAMTQEPSIYTGKQWSSEYTQRNVIKGSVYIYGSKTRAPSNWIFYKVSTRPFLSG